VSNQSPRVHRIPIAGGRRAGTGTAISPPLLRRATDRVSVSAVACMEGFVALAPAAAAAETETEAETGEYARQKEPRAQPGFNTTRVQWWPEFISYNTDYLSLSLLSLSLSERIDPVFINTLRSLLLALATGFSLACMHQRRMRHTLVVAKPMSRFTDCRPPSPRALHFRLRARGPTGGLCGLCGLRGMRGL